MIFFKTPFLNGRLVLKTRKSQIHITIYFYFYITELKHVNFLIKFEIKTDKKKALDGGEGSGGGGWGDTDSL